MPLNFYYFFVFETIAKCASLVPRPSHHPVQYTELKGKACSIFASYGVNDVNVYSY